MIKQKSGRELDREKSRGKKRYIERVIQENEAETEIKEFDLNEDIPDEGGADRFDGFRPDRS